MDGRFVVIRFLCIFSLLFITEEFFSSVSFAQVSRFQSETSSSARALGMGNAAINTERGPFSVFYNPANIAAKNTKTHIEVVNFQLETNEGLYSLGTKASSITDLGSLYPDLKANKGKFVGGRFSVYPNVTFRNFSVGLLYEMNRGAMVNSFNDSLFVRARDRFAPVGALSFRLMGGVLRFGASVQYLTVGEVEVSRAAPINSSNLSYAEFIRSGAGIQKNAGLTVTFPFRYLPSFSFVARDIGNTTFSLPGMISFGNEKSPTTRQMTFDLAASFMVLLTKQIDITFEADYKDFFNKNKAGRARHLFYGAEISAYNFLHLRGGLMNGYYTAGLGVGSKAFSMDAAIYTNEFEDRYKTSPDTRYVLQFSWGLFK